MPKSAFPGSTSRAGRLSPRATSPRETTRWSQVAPMMNTNASKSLCAVKPSPSASLNGARLTSTNGRSSLELATRLVAQLLKKRLQKKRPQKKLLQMPVLSDYSEVTFKWRDCLPDDKK